MKSLAESLSTRTNTPEYIIGVIEKSGMDQIILDHLHPTSDDKEFNILLSKFQASFYNVIRHLENRGLITIHGTKIRRNLNK